MSHTVYVRTAAMPFDAPVTTATLSFKSLHWNLLLVAASPEPIPRLMQG
jgi:hypothetical protein